MESIRLRMLIPVFLSGLLFVSCAQAPVKPAPPTIPLGGGIRGTVILQDNTISMAGALAQIGEEKTTVGPDGSFFFSAAPLGKQSLVVEKGFPAGKVRRVMGVSVLFVTDNPIGIRVPARDATDVDRFCLDCHPPFGKSARKDLKVRDIHISGVFPVNAKGDRSLLNEEGKMTCESCHVAHKYSPFGKFGVGDLNSGEFCNRCHRSGG